MELYSVPSLVDAKNDYTRKLTRILKKAFMARILKLYEDVRENCLNFHEEEKILIIFQERLSDIASWNNDQKIELSDEIIFVSSCDWIDDLITAVFVLHTKILGTIRSKNPPKKINIDIPDTKEFIYTCYLDIAREIWKHVYLFQETSDSCEYQKNYNTCETLIANSISETIREMLPVKELLREHLANLKFTDEEDEDDEDDDDEDTKQFTKKKKVKPENVEPIAPSVDKESVVESLESFTEPVMKPVIEPVVVEPIMEPFIETVIEPTMETTSGPVVSFDSLISGDDSGLTPILQDPVKIEPETKDVFIGKVSSNDSKADGFAELDFRNIGGGDTFNEVSLDYDQC